MNQLLVRRVLRSALQVCGLLLVLTAVAGTSLAGGGGAPLGVPEIDMNSAASALTLLAGGMMVLRGRKGSAS